MKAMIVFAMVFVSLTVFCLLCPPAIFDETEPAGLRAASDNALGKQMPMGPPQEATPSYTEPKTHAEIADYALLPISELGQIQHLPAVLFTKDGKFKIVGTNSGKVAIIDNQTGKLVRHFTAIEGELRCLALSPDERLVCAVSEDGKAVVREIATGDEVARADRIGAKAAAFSPDGKLIALAVGNNVELRTSSLELVHRFEGHTAQVNAVAFDPKGTHIASVSADRTVRLWNTNTKERRTLEGHTAELHAVAFTPDGKHLASGGMDNAIRIWEVETGNKVHDTLGPQPYWITALGFSPCGRYVAAGDESCDVWVYEWRQKQLIHHGKHHHECWLASVAWSADAEFFTFGCRPNSYQKGSLQTADPDAVRHLAIQNNGELRKGMDRARELQLQRLDIIAKNHPELRDKIESYKNAYAGQVFNGYVLTSTPAPMADLPADGGPSESPLPAQGAMLNTIFTNGGAQIDDLAWLEGLPELADLEEKDPDLKKLGEEIRSQSEVNGKMLQEEQKKAQETVNMNYVIKQWRCE